MRVRLGQCRRRRLVMCLTTVLTSLPFGVRPGRRIGQIVVPLRMYGREGALVVVGIPEGKLLAAMGGAERAVDIDDFLSPWRDRLAELIDERAAQP